MTQEEQVIRTLKELGGFATLRKLYEAVDFSTWKTKTPEASIRQIVQKSPEIFKIQPGLWALEDFKTEVLQKFKIKEGNKKSEEEFSHAYYQGLLVEIGKLKSMTTFVPAQDKNRLFLGSPLSEITDITKIPEFTYETLLKRAKTIDVIWFNERNMPSSFYEIEHTTDIKNSLSKYYELQDFSAKFYIVADNHREEEFKDKISASIFNDIRNRVKFLSYELVVGQHSSLKNLSNFNW